LAQAPDIEEVRYQRGLAYLGLGEVEKTTTSIQEWKAAAYCCGWAKSVLRV
jgi:hypothetical protein